MDGKIIKDAREKMGITQEDLAKAIGVQKSTVSLWESGQRSPLGDNLAKLASFLKIEAKILGGYEEEEDLRKKQIEALREVHETMQSINQRISAIENILSRIFKV